MRLFTVKDHDGKYIKGCSVVVAPNKQTAARILDRALVERGLKPIYERMYLLEDMDPDVLGVRILFDGNY